MRHIVIPRFFPPSRFLPDSNYRGPLSCDGSRCLVSRVSDRAPSAHVFHEFLEMSSMPKQETLGAGLARLSKAAERTRLLSETRIEWELYENRLLRLNGAGACVTCLEGLVLITAYDQPEDITLSAGEVFIVP